MTARLVATWTDLLCGCSRNEHKAWIFTSYCPEEHWKMAPDQAHVRGWLRRRGEGQAYGPVRVGRRTHEWL